MKPDNQNERTNRVKVEPGSWSLRLARAKDCLKQGYRRPLLLAADSALTVGLDERPSISQAMRTLTDPGMRNYDKASALISIADKVIPVSGIISRWARSRRLPLKERPVPVAFGTGATVYRFERRGRSWVLKVLRRSLGLGLGKLLPMADEFRQKHEMLCSLYNDCSQIVLPSQFLILNSPLFGQPAVAVLQAYIEGEKTDFYLDHTDEELLQFFKKDARLRQCFVSFARQSLQCHQGGRWCLDIVGRDNLLLVRRGGRRRLVIADCGIFDLKAIRQDAPERSERFESRIRRTRRILGRLTEAGEGAEALTAVPATFPVAQAAFISAGSTEC